MRTRARLGSGLATAVLVLLSFVGCGDDQGRSTTSTTGGTRASNPGPTGVGARGDLTGPTGTSSTSEVARPGAGPGNR